jgi:23S rRNA (cytidine1920-2'-O)/16S rRNA (cytidine1409-2'-O)-methyltransferase
MRYAPVVAGKRRLDTLLVQRGLVESPERAKAAILAGCVLVDEEPVLRPGTLIAEDRAVRLSEPPRYVGRGGEKLEHALDAFGLDVGGLVAIDVGASTGGFTDCLLQRGAARVYAVDVGYGLLAYKLRQDPRVRVLERTNVRHLTSLPERPDLATIDVSFISLEKAIAPVVKLLKPTGRIVALVKPQFQASRREVGKGGVVRDALTHAAVLGRVASWAVKQGLSLRGLTTSPLRGPAGNKEFFLLLALPAAGDGTPSGEGT